MITNLADVLIILETDYKILSITDVVKVRVSFQEVEVPLDLWAQAIMLQSNILHEPIMRAKTRIVGE